MGRRRRGQAAHGQGAVATATKGDDTEAERALLRAAAAMQTARRAEYDSLFRRVRGALVVIIASVYGRTLHPTIQGGDSGELATEGCSFGIAHPPGYPLLTLAGNAMALLPHGSRATVWTTNLFNALVSTMAALMLYWSIVAAIGTRSAVSIWCAAAATAAYAFSPLIWLYAVGNEVFPLNQLFVTTLVYITLRYAQTGDGRWVNWGAFVCGLALTNQHTIVLFEAPLILWILSTQWRAGRSQRVTATSVARWAACFAAGLAPYLYLPIAHSMRPRPGAWGEPSTLVGFIRHITRADYGTFKLYAYEGRETAGLVERTGAFGTDFSREQGGPLMAAGAAIGIAVVAVLPFKGSWRARVSQTGSTAGAPCGLQHVRRALLATLVTYIVVFHSLSNTPLDDPMFFGVHARFWQQPNVLMFLFAAVGLAAVLDPLSRRIHLGRRAWPVAILLLGVVAARVHAVFDAQDQSTNTYVERFGRATLHALKPDAIIVTADDLKWGSLQYLQHCEGVRPDVTVLSAPVMSYSWFASQRGLFPRVNFPGANLGITRSKAFVDGEVFSLKTFIDANVAHRPVYFDGMIGGYAKTDDAHEAAYEFRPAGLTREAIKKPTSGSQMGKAVLVPAETLEEEWRKVRDYLTSPPSMLDWPAGTWERAVASVFWDQLVLLETYLINQAGLARDSGVSPSPYLLLAAKLLDQYEGTEGVEMSTKEWRDLGMVYYGLAVEPALSADVCGQHIIPLRLDDGTATTAAADSLREWRVLAPRRTVYAWSRWMSDPATASDPEFASLEAAVKYSSSAIASDSATTRTTSGGKQGEATAKRESRKRTRKTKTKATKKKKQKKARRSK